MQDHPDLVQIPRETRGTYTIGEIVQHVRDQVINDSLLLARISALEERIEKQDAEIKRLHSWVSNIAFDR